VNALFGRLGSLPVRDLYAQPPAQPAPRVSRRGFFGLARGSGEIAYDRATEQIRARDYEALARAVGPVEDALRGFATGRVLELPLTAWRAVDPQALPYPDGAFDAVISAFGAALAPRPRRTARELVRVVRPGGVVAIAAWVPKGLPGRLDELLERPEGVRAPSDWGRREVMAARFEPWLEDFELRTRTVQLSYPDAETFYAAIGAPAGEEFALDRLLASCNNGFDRVEIDARYLVGMGRRVGERQLPAG
jgi:SAM-dependent methyltransferase